ncbi:MULTISPECIES: DUF4275 family protein [Bacillus]|nr:MULTISPECIES: DUF4275 family protein [Bacillus]
MAGSFPYFWYVVDKGFNWTYVQTHETGWYGSYFSWEKW